MCVCIHKLEIEGYICVYIFDCSCAYISIHTYLSIHMYQYLHTHIGIFINHAYI